MQNGPVAKFSQEDPSYSTNAHVHRFLKKYSEFKMMAD
jgi:hypothetical protein